MERVARSLRTLAAFSGREEHLFGLGYPADLSTPLHLGIEQAYAHPRCAEYPSPTPKACSGEHAGDVSTVLRCRIDRYQAQLCSGLHHKLLDVLQHRGLLLLWR